MRKLYRSLLWSGVVAAGVAACGDDVTVTPPATPTPTVHSVSVGPTGVTLGVGQTLQMIASVNADAGVATTVTWSINAPGTVATISATGLLTAVGTGNVAVQACSTANTSVCGNATVVISSQAATVQQVNVVPNSASLVRPATGSTSLQLSAAVIGSNNPSQVVTWSLPGSPANASISASGLLTITSAIAAPSTVNVSACSTVAGFTGVCGFGSVNIQFPTPASVSISSVTWVPAAGAPTNCTPTGPSSVPVVLTNVSCQIEVTANVNAGDQILSRIDVLIGGQVVASQTFPGTAASNGDEASVSAPVDITLSVNTRQVKSGTTAGGSCNNFACIPVIFNGNQQITLNLYAANSATPLASNAIPVVMNNADAVTYPKTLASTVATPSFTNGGVTYFKGSQTITGSEYIAFSKQVPTTASFTGTLCGASSTVVTGTAVSGILLGGVFACAGVEGQNTVSTAAVPAFAYAAAIGPDGTPITPPAFFSTVGTGFTVPINATGTTELRWNLLLQNGAPVPLPTALALVGVDNKAPTVTIGNVAFNDLFDQMWVNASYAFAQDVGAADGGSGLAAGMPQAHDYSAGVFVPPSAGCTGNIKVTGNDYPETITSDGSPEGWRICAFATDNLGNSASSGPSNFFGVDKVAPSVRLAGSTTATPSIAPNTVASVSTTPNTTIYGDGAGPLSGTFPVMPATDVWGLEALDTRSGFNQNAVAGFPASQTESRLAVLGPSSCGSFTSPLSVVLSDNWVRTPVLVALDCGLGIGYYNYNGSVWDRAGNQSAVIARNFAQDHLAAPTLASIGASTPLYTAGTAASFFLFGSDDLEIIEGDLSISYPNLGLITATIEGVTYPLSTINGTNPGIRWDNLLNNIVTAGTITVANLLGRVDFTCTGAGTPYAGCAAVDGVTATANAYNTVNTTNDGQSPDSARAVAFDVASNASGAVATGLLSIQTTDVAAPWGGADIVAWRILTPTGATLSAEHKASTSITAPYFDSVLLARTDAGGTELRVCGTFPAPTFTDNGFNRFYTYTITKPTGTAQCAAGGNWYAIGLKGAAALVTIGQP